MAAWARLITHSVIFMQCGTSLSLWCGALSWPDWAWNDRRSRNALESVIKKSCKRWRDNESQLMTQCGFESNLVVSTYKIILNNQILNLMEHAFHRPWHSFVSCAIKAHDALLTIASVVCTSKWSGYICTVLQFKRTNSFPSFCSSKTVLGVAPSFGAISSNIHCFK